VAKKSKYNQVDKMGRGIQNPLTKRLYTLKEAAAYLGTSVWRMRELIWQGSIPAVTLAGGRKIYVDIKDLDAFIEKNKTVYR
jgi:excisionase family DNA binding protein